MNRLAAICSFAALIPLATGAMERTSIEKELDELNVNAEIVAVSAKPVPMMVSP